MLSMLRFTMVGIAEGMIYEILSQIELKKGLQAKDVNCRPMAAAKEIPKESKMLNNYLSTHTVGACQI